MRPRVRLRHQLARRAKTFYVAGVRRRLPRTIILDGASDAFTSAFRNPFSPLHGTLVLESDPATAGTDDTFNLREDEVEAQERGKETKVGHDPARDRVVRAIRPTSEGHNGLTDRAWVRRRWDVAPLCFTATRCNSGLS